MGDDSELIEFLKQNLSIGISQDTEFGPVEIVTVRLELDGKIISESSCSLPDAERSVF